MAPVAIRNLPDEVYRAPKFRATQHSRSTEAEIRAIPEAAVLPENRQRIGAALAEISWKMGLTNEDMEALNQVRDSISARPTLLSRHPSQELPVSDGFWRRLATLATPFANSLTGLAEN